MGKDWYPQWHTTTRTYPLARDLSEEAAPRINIIPLNFISGFSSRKGRHLDGFPSSFTKENLKNPLLVRIILLLMEDIDGTKDKWGGSSNDAFLGLDYGNKFYTQHGLLLHELEKPRTSFPPENTVLYLFLLLVWKCKDMKQYYFFFFCEASFVMVMCLAVRLFSCWGSWLSPVVSGCSEILLFIYCFLLRSKSNFIKKWELVHSMRSDEEYHHLHSSRDKAREPN